MADVYITAALRLLESQLASSGRFTGGVSIGQPAGPPDTPFASVFLSAGVSNMLTMSTFIRQRDVTIRIYLDAIDEPRDEAEMLLDEIVYDTEDDIRNNLNMSTTSWQILPGGQFSEAFDYVDVGGRIYRIADISIPLAYRA